MFDPRSDLCYSPRQSLGEPGSLRVPPLLEG
jgi:hypothetical protein